MLVIEGEERYKMHTWLKKLLQNIFRTRDERDREREIELPVLSISEELEKFSILPA